jgi:RHS repeat-associated protein
MSGPALSPTTASARPTQTANGVTEHVADDQVAPAPPHRREGGRRLHTSGTPIEEVASSATGTSSPTSLLQDGTGSTRLLANSTGSVVATYAYDAYGNLTTESGSATTPLLFQGQYFDQALGADDLRGRWYDPGSAQFLSVDPLLAATETPFGDAGGDPVNFSDPTGLFGGPGQAGCNGRLFALGACPQEVAAIQAGSCSLSNFQYYSALANVLAPFAEVFDALDVADLAADGAEAETASTFEGVGRPTAPSPDVAYHYTGSPDVAESIAQSGLRPGALATPNGELSPLQAQIDLALPPNRGLPTGLVQIDVAGLRDAGFEIPDVTQVGRSYGLPGGGWEMQFPCPLCQPGVRQIGRPIR